MTNKIEFEQYECLRINHEGFSLLYYPSLKIMNVLYFDIEEDEEVEDTLLTKEDLKNIYGYDIEESARVTIIKEAKIEFDINKSTDERFNLKKLKEIYKCVIEVMSPDEFLFYCQYKKYKFDQKKVDHYRSLLTKSKIPVPILVFKTNNKELKAAFHDGQHRVLALKQEGIKKIKVLCCYEKH